MSMSAEVHDTILSFCVANNIPQDKAIALLREIVEDMNGDGDNYDFSFVANVYASSQQAAQQGVQLTGLCVCPEEWSVDIHGNCSNCGLAKTPRNNADR